MPARPDTGCSGRDRRLSGVMWDCLMRLWPGFKRLKFLLKLSMPRSTGRCAEQLPQGVLMRDAKSVGGRDRHVGNDSSSFPIRATHCSSKSAVRNIHVKGLVDLVWLARVRGAYRSLTDDLGSVPLLEDVGDSLSSRPSVRRCQHIHWPLPISVHDFTLCPVVLYLS